MNLTLLKVILAAIGTAVIFLVGWWLVKGINEEAKRMGIANGQDKRNSYQKLKDLQKLR